MSSPSLLPQLPDLRCRLADHFASAGGDAARRPVRVPVYRQLLSDCLTPVAAYLRLTEGDRADHSFLLESVTGGERIGRYSFLGAHPKRLVEVAASSEISGDPLDQLRDALGHTTYLPDPALPPFTGGLVGYAAFDLVRYFEADKLRDSTPHDDRGLPDLLFGLYDELVIFDNVQRTATVVSHLELSIEEDLEQAYADAEARLDVMIGKLTRGDGNDVIDELRRDGITDPTVEQNLSRDQFESNVRRGIEYIRAGDIFQFVPSLRLRVESEAEPFDVYRVLRVINPSPFMFYLKSPSCTLIGNSPEILCRVEGRTVQTRPLAGTRPRGKSAEEDDALGKELLADEKERAENIMLVDLHRNDIGRVAATGTVSIDNLMTLEHYSHVMHIVTNISAELDEPFDAIDALRVSLPVGTVSGAPKIRAMQIIDEVEPTRRGPYGGAVGHIDFGGDMDTCIALRTIIYHDGKFDIQAGAGVVGDSDPGREYEECRQKAAAMLSAVSLAASGLTRPSPAS